MIEQLKSRKMIPLARPYFDSEELNEIHQVLESGWVSQGPKVREFEERAAQFYGVKHAIAVTNCTSALHLAVIAIGVQEGDEVLVADYTFPATGHSVLYCRAKPIFVDVDPRTYNIDPELIEKAITPRTKAIIPVHTFGQPANMDAIMEVAGRKNLKVIEDAACAFGATYNGKYAGTIGQIGCFSFHARKGITTGEGGMVITNDSEIAERIRRLSTFGMTSAWDREGKVTIPEFIELGFNYKMSDITAAVGVVQLRRLAEIIAKKRTLAEYWDKKLQQSDLIKPPHRDEKALHIYQAYVGLVDKKVNRNKVIQQLLEQGIQTQIGTYASHIQPIYSSEQKCPNSFDIFNRSLALPMYFSLSESDIDLAATQLEKTLKQCLW